MQLSSADRVLACLAFAYFSYRVVSAVKSGVYEGDGDRDVYVDRNPVAFVMTVASGVLVAALLAILLLADRSRG